MVQKYHKYILLYF